MPTIALVDDRADNRATIKGLIDMGLRRIEASDTWESMESHPLENLGEYTSWIAENDVSVLVLDERLSEASPVGRRPVSYSGHQVVDHVREHFRTLPIFMITSHPDVDALRERFGAIDDIIDRREFSRPRSQPPGRASTLPRYVDYVTRMVRVGTNFYEEHQAELEELALLAERIARGEASDEDVRKVKGLQQSISLPFIIEPLRNRDEWLTTFEKQIGKFAELETRIRRHLEKDGGDEVG